MFAGLLIKSSVFLMNVLNIIGIIIIAIGALRCVGTYLFSLLHKNLSISNDQMRLELGKGIVLAVEFMLAADILKTIITPDYYQIGILGTLVIIRTVLTYFLNLELVQIQQKNNY